MTEYYADNCRRSPILRRSALLPVRGPTTLPPHSVTISLPGMPTTHDE